MIDFEVFRTSMKNIKITYHDKIWKLFLAKKIHFFKEKQNLHNRSKMAFACEIYKTFQKFL